MLSTTVRESALIRLATLGKALASSLPNPEYDHNTFARRCMVLGAARAAYQEIKAGRGDPLEWLYRVEEFSCSWQGMGFWPELSNLIDRLTIEANIEPEVEDLFIAGDRPQSVQLPARATEGPLFG